MGTHLPTRSRTDTPDETNYFNDNDETEIRLLYDKYSINAFCNLILIVFLHLKQCCKIKILFKTFNLISIEFDIKKGFGNAALKTILITCIQNSIKLLFIRTLA